MAPPKMVHLKAGETLKFASQTTSFQDMREGKARLVKVSTPAKAKASPNEGKVAFTLEFLGSVCILT